MQSPNRPATFTQYLHIVYNLPATAAAVAAASLARRGDLSQNCAPRSFNVGDCGDTVQFVSSGGRADLLDSVGGNIRDDAKS
jgi:hypothetical protein